jgi:two-component system, NarL family, nitrate/nitrite response regulator NarL
LAVYSVFLIDPSRLFREAVRRLLDSVQFSVVGDAPSWADAQPWFTAEPHIDLITFDPAGCGEEEPAVGRLQAVRDRFPGVRIAVLTGDHTPDALLRAIGWSVDAYLTKDMAPETLSRSLQLVMLGQQIIPAGLLRSLPEARDDQDSRRGEPGDGSSQGLSAREAQILCCLLNGHSNKAIARELGITEATVKAHLKALLRKIRVRNRTQAALWGLTNGFDPSPHPKPGAGWPFVGSLRAAAR